jgi:hypothetical protein
LKIGKEFHATEYGNTHKIPVKMTKCSKNESVRIEVSFSVTWVLTCCILQMAIDDKFAAKSDNFALLSPKKRPPEDSLEEVLSKQDSLACLTSQTNAETPLSNIHISLYNLFVCENVGVSKGIISGILETQFHFKETYRDIFIRLLGTQLSSYSL